MNKIDNVDKDFVADTLTSEIEVLHETLPAKGTVHFQSTAFDASAKPPKAQRPA